MINNLLDEGKENQINMIVVDEIHMLSDRHRGFLLEVILSKINNLPNEKIQIIGMSATLPNIVDLSVWLGSSLYRTEFRPVDLSVRVCMNKKLYNIMEKLEDATSSKLGHVAAVPSASGVKDVGIKYKNPYIKTPYSVAAAVDAGSNHEVPSPTDFKYEMMDDDCVPMLDNVSPKSAPTSSSTSSSSSSLSTSVLPSTTSSSSSIPVLPSTSSNTTSDIMDIESPVEEIFVRKRSVRYRPSGLTQMTDDMRISESDNMEDNVKVSNDMDDNMKISLSDNAAKVDDLNSILPLPLSSLEVATVTSTVPAVGINNSLNENDVHKLGLESKKFDPFLYDFEFDRDISSDIFYNNTGKSTVTTGNIPPDRLMTPDPDGLYALCLEPLIKGKSVMLFCPSKARCEVCAGELANIIKNCSALNPLQGFKNTNINDTSASASASARGRENVKSVSDRESKENLNVGREVSKVDITALRYTLLDELRLAPVRLCEVRYMIDCPCAVRYSDCIVMMENRYNISFSYLSPFSY